MNEPSLSKLKSLRASIEKVYSPDLFSLTGTKFVEALASYLKDAASNPSPVFPKQTADELMALAAQSLDNASDYKGQNSQQIGATFALLSERFLKHAQRIHSPRYIGHQVPPPVPAASLFDSLTSVTNQGLAVSEMGPFALALERALIKRLCAKIGWQPEESAGIVTGGGTLANLTAILAARNTRYGSVWEEGLPRNLRPAIITSGDSHYSISRACGVLGIGTNQVIKAQLDTCRRLDPSQLENLIQISKAKGLDVFCVVASSPSTAIGAFDKLSEIAKITQKHGLWLHVDGAHGASVLFSNTHKHLVQGIDLADSVTWDAHKMLYVPSLSTYLLFKNKKASMVSFAQDAPYLFDKTLQLDAEINPGLRTLECTKRGLSVGLWGLWSLYSEKLFSDLIDLTFLTAKEFYLELKSRSDFEPVHEPEANIVCFRHLPPALKQANTEQISNWQNNLRIKLQDIGDFYITITKLDGVSALRVTIINPLTSNDTLNALLDHIALVGKSAL